MVDVKIAGVASLLVLSCLFLFIAIRSSSSPPNFTQHLSGKRILLCGIGYEVGEQLAYDLASHGAKLAIFYRADGRQKTLLNLQRTFELTDNVIQIIQPLMVARTDTKAIEIKEKALELGSPQVDIFPFDFGNVSTTHLVVDTAVSLLGGLDHVILNHADIPRGIFLKSLKLQDTAVLTRTFSVNLYSFINIALRALPHLEKTSGHLFVTSSILGEVPKTGLSSYTSTKHGINGFFYSLQHELAQRGSKVSLTVGSLGIIKSNELLGLMNIPETMMGDIQEAAIRIMSSLISKPKTMTYPYFQPNFARLMWSLFSI